MPRGRPDTYLKMTESEREELKRKIENLGAKGYSEVAIAHEIGVPRGTLQGWEKRHADISAALSRARAAAQSWWEAQALEGNVGHQPGQINPAVWKITMATRFRADYGPAPQQHEHSGPGGKSIEHKVRYQVVEAKGRKQGSEDAKGA